MSLSSSKWHQYLQQGSRTSGHQFQNMTSRSSLAFRKAATVNLLNLKRHFPQRAEHTIKMCGFSSFTCEMEAINTLFLLLTGSLGELKDICKVHLTQRLLCRSAKFIISNNTIKKKLKCLPKNLLKPYLADLSALLKTILIC